MIKTHHVRNAFEKTYSHTWCKIWIESKNENMQHFIIQLLCHDPWIRVLSWNRIRQKYPSFCFMMWCVCEIWQMPRLCFPQLPGRCELGAGSQIVGGLGDLRVKILAPPWYLCWINLHWIANDECRVNCWCMPWFTDFLLFETWVFRMTSRDHQYRPTWGEKDQVSFKEAGVRG